MAELFLSCPYFGLINNCACYHCYVTPSHHGERQCVLRNSRSFYYLDKKLKAVGRILRWSEMVIVNLSTCSISFSFFLLIRLDFYQEFWCWVKDIHWENIAFRSSCQMIDAPFIRHVYTLKTPVGLKRIEPNAKLCDEQVVCVCFSVAWMSKPVARSNTNLITAWKLCMWDLLHLLEFVFLEEIIVGKYRT